MSRALCDLNENVLSHALTFLEPKDLNSAAATCSYLSHTAEIAAKLNLDILKRKYLTSSYFQDVGLESKLSLFKKVLTPRMVVLGGSFDTTAVNVLETENMTWSNQNDMSSEREGFRSEVCKGEIFVISGEDEQVVGTVAKYNPISKRWSDVMALPDPVKAIGSAVFEDQVYVCGGILRSGEINDKMYVLENKVWKTVCEMKNARYAHGFASYEGKLYVAGGYLDNNMQPSTSVEYYDVDMDEWFEAPPMSKARVNLCLASVNGTLFALGGDMDGTIEMLNDGQWTIVASFRESRRNFSVAIQESEIVILGGKDRRNKFLNTCEIFDVETLSIDESSCKSSKLVVPSEPGFIFGQSVTMPVANMTW